MACFTVPLAGAVVAAGAGRIAGGKKKSNPFIARLPWLVKLSLGGSFLLAIEHIYHGEISFTPPFLTAMKDPAETDVMLHEMATVGVSMAVLLFVVWVGMVIVSAAVERAKGKEPARV
ncbi:MAG: hypothetical protein J6T01_05435 [Kiritimatiellae bacterium]|nr:hypothetical protein [Kiritimatiellia bacterium]